MTSLLQKLNKYPTASLTGLAILGIGLAIFFLRSGPKPGEITIARREYYSADDGKTFFVDDVSKPSPHKAPNGGEVLRACVFSCDGKQLFVGYLERDDGGGAATADPVGIRPTSDPSPGPTVPGALGSKRIKRPGEKAWTPITTIEGLKIIGVRCPNGDAATRMSPPE